MLKEKIPQPILCFSVSALYESTHAKEGSMTGGINRVFLKYLHWGVTSLSNVAPANDWWFSFLLIPKCLLILIAFIIIS